MTKKDKLAVMMVQDRKFWKLCDNLEWRANLHEQYKKVTKAVETFGKANFPVKVTITGVHPGDVSHYDMEDVVKEKFGDKVMLDSESGQFFCYAPAAISQKVVDFIEEKIIETNGGEKKSLVNHGK